MEVVGRGYKVTEAVSVSHPVHLNNMLLTINHNFEVTITLSITNVVPPLTYP